MSNKEFLLCLCFFFFYCYICSRVHQIEWRGKRQKELFSVSSFSLRREERTTNEKKKQKKWVHLTSIWSFPLVTERRRENCKATCEQCSSRHVVLQRQWSTASHWNCINLGHQPMITELNIEIDGQVNISMHDIVPIIPASVLGAIDNHSICKILVLDYFSW